MGSPDAWTVVALVAGAIGGGVVTWLLGRSRGDATVAALRAELEAERRFAAERREQAARADLFLGQLATLADTHRDLSTRTQHLVDALRSPVVRGEWGEMQLRRVCELARMHEHVDYVLQRGTPGDGALRPDLTVQLPGRRAIVVDAKAPMQAWLDAMEAPDDETRTDALREHARHVREHITRLGAKSYWAQFEDAPRFVVLFLPGESLFAAALQHDATLVEYGMSRQVVLASPTTLLALLRAVGDGWEREAAHRNAEVAVAQGRELHHRLELFAGHLDEVRRGIERAVDGYNRAAGALEHRVLPQARRLGELTGAGDGSTPEVTAVEGTLRGGSGG
ncbi:MAG: DNA recombination protein RmuC [Gemmatimonadetes bacterium]|nr:DNA recombination protein RmuC [Gemmatimonadota bacterium]